MSVTGAVVLNPECFIISEKLPALNLMDRINRDLMLLKSEANIGLYVLSEAVSLKLI